VFGLLRVPPQLTGDTVSRNFSFRDTVSGKNFNTPGALLESEGAVPSRRLHMARDRYAWSGERLHVLRSDEETWCGGYPGSDTFDSFEDARKAHGHFGSIEQCKKCLTAKHSTDVSNGQLNVATTGE